MKPRKLRVIIPIAIVALAGIAYAVHFSLGNLSALGIQDLVMLCPLGALGSMLASKTIVPAAVFSLVCFVVLVVFVGKAFCAWVCPVPIVAKARSLFSRKRNGADGANAADDDGEAPTCAHDCNNPSCAKMRGKVLDSRHLILGGALGSALIFGFPVFCLVCPIGLTFASVFLIFNLFAHGDVTWTVVVVPLLLIVEVVFFRKWCHRLCPLAALMSLTSKANRTFRPTIDDKKCLETAKGAQCGKCSKACPESIDIRHAELSATALNECIKCKSCADACPGSAITFPFAPKRPAKVDADEENEESLVA